MTQQNSANTTPNKILRLSGGMHLDILLSRLKAATIHQHRQHHQMMTTTTTTTATRCCCDDDKGEDCTEREPQNDTIRSISCLNAQLEWVSEPLLELLKSREYWETLEFLHCQGLETILRHFLLENTTPTTTMNDDIIDTENDRIVVDTLSFKGGCDDVATARAIAMSLSSLSSSSSSSLFSNSAVVKKHNKIQIRRLELNDFFTNAEAMRAIGKGLVTSTSLQYLDLSNSTFPTASTLSRYRSYKKYDKSNKQHQQPLDYFIQALNLMSSSTNLQGFACEHCRLPDEYVARLVRAVASNSATSMTLQTLKLRGNSCCRLTLDALTMTTTTDNTTTTTTDVSLFPKLKVLAIEHEELSEDPLPELQSFFATLPRAFPNLESLSISNYMIPLEYMQTLVDDEALPKCQNLFDLRLQACGTTTWGIRHLALRLPALPTLKSLSIPDDGASHELLGGYNINDDNNNNTSSGGLQANTTLCHLSMARPLTTRHEYLLDLNRGGRRLLQRQTTTTTSTNKNDDNVDRLWPIVLERAQRIPYYGGPHRSLDVMYLLLRNRILLEQR